MPFVTFVAGATLTAAQLNDNLMKQAVIVCTSGTRPASPVDGMTVYESDTRKHMYYNGTSWQGIKPGLISATVATSETTASTTYVDLTTAGPAAVAVTGATALVIITAKASASVQDMNYIGFAISGATTVAATDAQALQIQSMAAGLPLQTSAVYVAAGLTPGTNTFTLKYRQNGASTGTYLNRTIMVVPL